MKKIIPNSVLFLFFLTGCTQQNTNEEKINEPKNSQSQMTEAEAQTIAEASCVKGGEALGEGTYNPNSKTWWFDANLNAVREGCSPACVVSEETKTAEINWRCTGVLNLKEETQNASIQEKKRILLDAQSLPLAGNPSPNAMLVNKKLCNLVEFNNEAPNTTITYNNPKMGISFEVPYNKSWGNEDFEISAFNEKTAEEAMNFIQENETEPELATINGVEFGPIYNAGEFNWLRMYDLSFETAKNTQDTINSININGQLALTENPVAVKINDLDVVKYTTQGVYSVPTLEVIGKKHNYKFYIQGTDIEKDFQTLENIIKTVKLID